jgi:hypothetical protein
MGRRGNGVEYVDRNMEKEIARRGNGVEYVDRNREERDEENRNWGGTDSYAEQERLNGAEEELKGLSYEIDFENVE